MRKFIKGFVAATLIAGVTVAATAPANAAFRGFHGFHGRPGHFYHGGGIGVGGAIAAGLVGLGVGAAIASTAHPAYYAPPPPPPPPYGYGYGYYAPPPPPPPYGYGW